MLQVIEKYRKEFDLLVNTAHRACVGAPIVITHQYQKELYVVVKRLLPNRQNNSVVMKQEIRQQLLQMWVHYVKQYRANRPKVALRTYLIRRSIWGLRDWLKRQLYVMDHTPLPVEPEPEVVQVPFRLDLRFLVYGTSYFPLSELSAYERYLIFLLFGEEKTILEISESVQKTRKTVSLHIKKTINKLRSLVDAATIKT